MSVTDKIDLYISQYTGDKKAIIVIGKKMYSELCIALKRNVRTYKGFKVKAI